MSETVSTGPSISAGPLLGGPGAPDNNTLAGPSITYQGDSIPDPRFPILGGAVKVGSIRSHLDSPYLLMTDAVPAASAATPVNIAPAANAVSGVAMTLAGASAGITPAVPFYPFGSGAVVNSGVTLDFGFAAVSATAGSNVFTPAAGTMPLYQQGQWLVIGNVGAAGTCLIGQIGAVGPSTFTLLTPGGSPLNAVSTNAAAPVGAGNVLDPFAGAPATAWAPYYAAGPAALFNPLDGVSRGVGIAGSASATGGAFKVVGYDIYGQAMSETITAAAGVGPTYGKKAFKHIVSATPQFSDAHTYSVGTSDVFGFALRNDKWEYDNLYVASSFLSVSTGWSAADQTSPATPTTGDVRGTIQVGSRGPLGSGASGGPMDGVKRLALFMTIPAYNLISATPATPAPMYGVTQA